MSTWPTEPLRALCKFSSGGKMKLTKQHYTSSGFPAFSAAGQDGYLPVHEFDQPGVVVSSIGARCGKAFLAVGKWTSLANTYCVLPDCSKVDVEFLWYLLNDEKSWKRSGSAQPFIKPSDIQNRHVPLPPLEEQRCIVDILNRANGIRRLRRAALAKFRQLIPTLFVDMFGDPATNPRGLRKAQLGEVIKVRSGTFLPARSMAVGGCYSVYGGNGVNGYHSEYLFKAPVIVIGRVGAQCGNVHLSGPQCWVTDNALYVAEQSADLDQVYLATALRRANLNQRASQSGQPLISGGRIYPVEILIPPLNRQKSFANQVADIQATIAQQERMAEASDQLVAALMARLFDGG